MKLTTRQEDILREYSILSRLLQEKGENAENEASDIQQWASTINEFVQMVQYGDNSHFEYVDELSQKPYDICHIDQYIEEIERTRAPRRSDDDLSDHLHNLNQRFKSEFPEVDE